MVPGRCRRYRLAEPLRPADDEVEFSAFGPGYGESLLIHLGSGEWMIVDSCVKDGRLPAIDYLQSLGVDPSSAVRLLVATHWHDDHVRGISRALERCTRADFVCSVALSHDELLAGIGTEPPGRFGKQPSGVDEMRGVLKHLDDVDELHRLVWTLEKGELYRRDAGPGPSCSVVALSPASRVVTDAQRRIAALLASLHDEGPPYAVPRPERNDGAVVVRVEVGDVPLLLGADLEETTNAHTGWTAVCKCLQGVQPRSQVFKVPHHGSQNAHQPLVWKSLLVRRPEAVVCPHRLGANYLPTEQDLARLCGLANVHLTAEPTPAGQSVRRRGRVGRITTTDFGRVTLRRRLGRESAWTISYEPPARPARR